MNENRFTTNVPDNFGSCCIGRNTKKWHSKSLVFFFWNQSLPLCCSTSISTAITGSWSGAGDSPIGTSFTTQCICLTHRITFALVLIYSYLQFFFNIGGQRPSTTTVLLVQTSQKRFDATIIVNGEIHAFADNTNWDVLKVNNCISLHCHLKPTNYKLPLK